MLLDELWRLPSRRPNPRPIRRVDNDGLLPTRVPRGPPNELTFVVYQLIAYLVLKVPWL